MARGAYTHPSDYSTLITAPLRPSIPSLLPSPLRLSEVNASSATPAISNSTTIHSFRRINPKMSKQKHQDLLPIVTVPSHQPCRKSRMSRGLMRVYVAGRYLACRFVSRCLRFFVCSARPIQQLLNPLSFWASHLSSYPCALKCVYVSDRGGSAARSYLPSSPSKRLFSLFISGTRHLHALHARLDAALEPRRKPQARTRIQTHPSGVPVAETFIHYPLSLANKLPSCMIRRRRTMFVRDSSLSPQFVNSAAFPSSAGHLSLERACVSPER